MFYFCMSFFSFVLICFDKNKVIKFLLVFLKRCHVTLGNIYRFISRRAMVDGKYNTSIKSDAIKKSSDEYHPSEIIDLTTWQDNGK